MFTRYFGRRSLLKGTITARNATKYEPLPTHEPRAPLGIQFLLCRQSIPSVNPNTYNVNPMKTGGKHHLP